MSRFDPLFSGDSTSDKADRDNHSNQLNSNNDAYWESRGCEERPDDWEDQAEKDDEDEEDD